MICTICNGLGYFKENQADCKTCSGSGQVYTMTSNEVFDLMYTSKSPEDWNHNVELVKLSYGGSIPPFWSDIIIKTSVLDVIRKTW